MAVYAVPTYTFDSLHVDVAPTEETQNAASLGLVATGTVETVTYDAAGAEQGRASEPFSKTFVLRPGGRGQMADRGRGGGWLTTR